MESKHWTTTLDVLKSYCGFLINLNLKLVEDMTNTEFTQLATLVIDAKKVHGQPLDSNVIIEIKIEPG